LGVAGENERVKHNHVPFERLDRINTAQYNHIVQFIDILPTIISKGRPWH